MPLGDLRNVTFPASISGLWRVPQCCRGYRGGDDQVDLHGPGVHRAADFDSDPDRSSLRALPTDAEQRNRSNDTRLQRNGGTSSPEDTDAARKRYLASSGVPDCARVCGLGDDTGTACRWYCRRIDHCVQLAESGLYLVDSHRCTMGIAPQCRLAYDCVDV